MHENATTGQDRIRYFKISNRITFYNCNFLLLLDTIMEFLLGIRQATTTNDVDDDEMKKRLVAELVFSLENCRIVGGRYSEFGYSSDQPPGNCIN